MMGLRKDGQGQFFYAFNLDEVVPPDHLVRQIDGVLDLSWVHKELAPYYSHTGRPSIDRVLMIRMLIVGYVFALRSERRRPATSRLRGRRQRRHPMPFSSTSPPWIPPTATLAVQAKAAIDTSLPRKSRLP